MHFENCVKILGLWDYFMYMSHIYVLFFALGYEAHAVVLGKDHT